MNPAPRAVIAAPNHWTSVLQVGTHHIARALVAEGWDVLYLSDPVSPFHLAKLGNVEVRQRFREYLNGPRLRDGVRSYVPATAISPRGPHLFGTSRLRHSWLRWSQPSVSRLLERSGFATPDLVWVDSVIWEGLLGVANGKRSVLRLADLSGGFARHHPDFDAMERRLARRVDAVVYSAKQLESHVRSLEPRHLLHMPNGVDLGRFETSEPFPREYEQIPSPRAVYVGAMAEWFDYDTVDRLVAAMPSVSFVLIGPDDLARRRLAPAQNLHLLGRQPGTRIPGFLQHANAGLIPFNTRDWPALVEAVHPLKLYEYVASGLPTVAAEWGELLSMHAPVRTYRTAEEAVTVLRATIDESPSVDRSWLDGTDWKDRIGAVLAALDLPRGGSA